MCHLGLIAKFLACSHLNAARHDGPALNAGYCLPVMLRADASLLPGTDIARVWRSKEEEAWLAKEP
jgi:hypothetical protein